MRKYPVVLVFVLLSVIYASHALAAASKGEEAVYVANFDYTPSSQETPGSAGVTFAIANVSFESNSFTPWPTWPQFANLDTAIKQDLNKLLAAKGFTVRGPFDSYDLIPYQDKKAIDLYAMPKLELSVVQKSNGSTLKISGKLTLVLKEVVTGELMWSKTTPLSEFDFPITWATAKWGKGLPWEKITAGTEAPIADMDVEPRNDMAKGIEKQYPELMATISKLIDPEEMRIIKKQCQELKSKKGY
ncbi:MAG: hypothetical protein WC317_00190 [Candidatus Omnitrophota bacterium]